MEHEKLARTLLPMSFQLLDSGSPSTEEERLLTSKIPYASAVESLIYTMVATHFDLAYVVGITSRYMSNPEKKHREAVKHIFCYLRGTENMQLTFDWDHPTEVKGFTDSNYVGNPDNRKSTSGYIFTYGGRAISWRSKLQDCTTLSTTKVESSTSPRQKQQKKQLGCNN